MPGDELIRASKEKFGKSIQNPAISYVAHDSPNMPSKHFPPYIMLMPVKVALPVVFAAGIKFSLHWQFSDKLIIESIPVHGGRTHGPLNNNIIGIQFFQSGL